MSTQLQEHHHMTRVAVEAHDDVVMLLQLCGSVIGNGLFGVLTFQDF